MIYVYEMSYHNEAIALKYCLKSIKTVKASIYMHVCLNMYTYTRAHTHMGVENFRYLKQCYGEVNNKLRMYEHASAVGEHDQSQYLPTSTFLI